MINLRSLFVCFLLFLSRTYVRADAFGSIGRSLDTVPSYIAFRNRLGPCDSILLTKMVDNTGEGEFYLQGVRNLRPVLKGVMYRSGANNLYSPYMNRDNSNPLPLQSLINIWEAGFTNIYYLYSTNFDKEYPADFREVLDKMDIHYRFLGPKVDSSRYAILKDVYTTIQHPEHGPVLTHCWNGWHMSGLISACALMQFCDFTNQKALAYWTAGTDKNDKGYETIKSIILQYRPYPDLIISDEQKKRICPCRE